MAFDVILDACSPEGPNIFAFRPLLACIHPTADLLAVLNEHGVVSLHRVNDGGNVVWWRLFDSVDMMAPQNMVSGGFGNRQMYWTCDGSGLCVADAKCTRRLHCEDGTVFVEDLGATDNSLILVDTLHSGRVLLFRSPSDNYGHTNDSGVLQTTNMADSHRYGSVVAFSGGGSGLMMMKCSEWTRFFAPHFVVQTVDSNLVLSEIHLQQESVSRAQLNALRESMQEIFTLGRDLCRRLRALNLSQVYCTGQGWSQMLSRLSGLSLRTVESKYHAQSSSANVQLSVFAKTTATQTIASELRHQLLLHRGFWDEIVALIRAINDIASSVSVSDARSEMTSFLEWQKSLTSSTIHRLIIEVLPIMCDEWMPRNDELHALMAKIIEEQTQLPQMKMLAQIPVAANVTVMDLWHSAKGTLLLLSDGRVVDFENVTVKLVSQSLLDCDARISDALGSVFVIDTGGASYYVAADGADRILLPEHACQVSVSRQTILSFSGDPGNLNLQIYAYEF